MKRSIVYSILFLKCPQCRQGNFLKANPYKLSNMNKVKEHCSKCGLKYSIEPSFYIGAMYVSYAVGVAVAIAVFVLTLIFGMDLGPGGILLSIVGTLVLTMPYIGAVSKSIWAHFFFKYNPKIANKASNDSRA
ncbi:MAG: DUF983 domain-containing protein [Flavobacteriaceae bacterium]|nr:DUF983 domain-containing protein [Flavobacteriaceae bacterium]